MKFTTLVSILATALVAAGQQTAGQRAFDKKASLDSHNYERANVVGSKGPRPNLTYDLALERSAQAYANKLSDNDVGLVHDTNRNGEGENLYYTSRSDHPTPLSAASSAWLAEKKDYQNCQVISGSDPNFAKYGHYTQAVWRSTTKLGMAYAKGKNTGRLYVVARYSPQGNYVGQSAC